MGEIHGHERCCESDGRLPDVAKFDSIGVSLRVDLPPDAPGLGLPLLSTTIVAARYRNNVPRGIGSTVVPAGADHGHAESWCLYTVTPPALNSVHGQLQLVQFAHLYIIAPGVGRRL